VADPLSPPYRATFLLRSSYFVVTKFVFDVRCESCDGVLVPPQLLTGPARRDAAYVCIRCNRPYHWIGDPPRLNVVRPKPTEPTDDD